MTDESARAFEIISALRTEFYADRKNKELCDELLDIWRICDGKTRAASKDGDHGISRSTEELRDEPRGVRAEPDQLDDKAKLVRASKRRSRRRRRRGRKLRGSVIGKGRKLWLI